MKRGALLNAGSLTSYRTSLETYDSNKLGLGNLHIQNNGASSEDRWVAPAPITALRHMEVTLPFACAMPYVMQWSNSINSEIDWEFHAELSTAAATRRIMMATYNRKTGVRSFIGGIILTFPGTSEAKTIRGFRMKYNKYITGTVSNSGTAVTGSGTTWLGRISVGARIGFGSTDPSAITTWYPISAVSSNTSITTSTTPSQNYPASTPYVIEELQAVLAVTSVTTTNGGLYVAKGLIPEIFGPVTATTVPAATTVDEIRAVYHLADASTVTNTVSLGMGLEDEIDASTHYVYVIDGLTTPTVFKYNLNTALTLTAGKATNAFVLKSGAAPTITGAPTQVNNGRLVTAAHGPGASQNCLYFTTSTRIYRSIPASTITSGSTTWIADNMNEVSVGGVGTYPVTNTLQSIEYSSMLDVFMIPTSSRIYVTKYKTDGSQWDRTLLLETRQYDQIAADSTTTLHPTINSTAFSTWIEGGLAYLTRVGTTALINVCYTFPLGADWEYAATSNNRVIFSKIETPDAKRYYSVFASTIQVVGGDTGKNLGMNTEPYRLYYRTGGIDDNSGGWNLIPDSGDISGASGANYIQIMAEFRVQWTGVAARIQSIGVIYEDTFNDSHFMPAANFSSATNKQFAWYFKTGFGATVPNLTVTLYDADSGGVLLTDITNAPTGGTFTKTTNGGTNWNAYDTNDRANATTYIRYTPTSLADNIKVRAVLSLS